MTDVCKDNGKWKPSIYKATVLNDENTMTYVFINEDDKVIKFVDKIYKLQSKLKKKPSSQADIDQLKDQCKLALSKNNSQVSKNDIDKQEHYYKTHEMVPDDIIDKLFGLVQANKKQQRKTRKNISKQNKQKSRRANK